MTREQLIRTAESLHPDLTYTREQILEMVKALDEPIEIDKELLLVDFMSDDKFVFDLRDINRIITNYKGVPKKESSLLDIVDEFKKIVLETTPLKDPLITLMVTIGKSKEPVCYYFLKSDFIRVEKTQLFLKDEDRRIHLFDKQELESLIKQMGV